MKQTHEKRLMRILARMQDLNQSDVLQCKRYADYAVAHGLPLEHFSPALMELCDNPSLLDPFVGMMKNHHAATRTHTRI
jgi:UV DNA damage repair endonuclease